MCCCSIFFHMSQDFILNHIITTSGFLQSIVSTNTMIYQHPLLLLSYCHSSSIITFFHFCQIISIAYIYYQIVTSMLSKCYLHTRILAAHASNDRLTYELLSNAHIPKLLRPRTHLWKVTYSKRGLLLIKVRLSPYSCQEILLV